MKKDLKVIVNRDKNKVGSPLKLEFLELSLGVSRDGAFSGPSKQSQQRVKQKLKEIKKHNREISLKQMSMEITCKMHGWIQCYSVDKMVAFMRRLDRCL